MERNMEIKMKTGIVQRVRTFSTSWLSLFSVGFRV